jgi:hypothetical protein
MDQVIDQIDQSHVVAPRHRRRVKNADGEKRASLNVPGKRKNACREKLSISYKNESESRPRRRGGCMQEQRHDDDDGGGGALCRWMPVHIL